MPWDVEVNMKVNVQPWNIWIALMLPALLVGCGDNGDTLPVLIFEGDVALTVGEDQCNLFAFDSAPRPTTWTEHLLVSTQGERVSMIIASQPCQNALVRDTCKAAFPAPLQGSASDHKISASAATLMHWAARTLDSCGATLTISFDGVRTEQGLQGAFVYSLTDPFGFDCFIPGPAIPRAPCTESLPLVIQ